MNTIRSVFGAGFQELLEAASQVRRETGCSWVSLSVPDKSQVDEITEHVFMEHGIIIEQLPFTQGGSL